MSARGARYWATCKGEPFYTVETPCKRGHLSPRRTTTGTCTACARSLEQARVAANRAKYNARKNRERVPHLPALAAKAKEAYANKTEAEKARIRAVARERSRLWRMANPTHAGAQQAKRRYKASPKGRSMMRKLDAQRRAAFLQRLPGWLTANDMWFIAEIYDLARLRSEVTGIAWDVDHIIPLQGVNVSGLHTPENLQVITKSANLRKGRKYDACMQPVERWSWGRSL